MAANPTVALASHDRYAAIAYSEQTGNYGYSYGFNCSQDAENDALSRCNGCDAQVVVWVKNGWAALAVGDNGAYGWGWSGNCRADAENIARQNCSGDNVRILCWVYSGN
jgi:hypothetical protein